MLVSKPIPSAAQAASAVTANAANVTVRGKRQTRPAIPSTQNQSMTGGGRWGFLRSRFLRPRA